MIVGSGIDIIETERIDAAIKRWGDGFLRHVFTDDEIAYAKTRRYPSQHFAARFAAKEAVLKAFGDNAHITWKDIEIKNDENGRPVCIYSDSAFRKRITISISHTRHYAVASAIIEE